MIAQSIRRGISFVRRKPGLVALIYGVNLVMAFIVAIPLYVGLSDIMSTSGFGFDLARETDLVVWADIAGELDPVWDSLLVQLMWLIPVAFVIKALSSVGIINAVRDDGIRSFWPGVGQYGLRSILVGLCYLVVLVGVITGTVLLYFVLSLAFPGDAASYRLLVYFLPVALIFVLALVDLFQDYSRITLVKDEAPVLKSFFAGFGWPWRNRSALGIYAFWFAAALVFVVLPTFLDAWMTAATFGGVLFLFVVQQLSLVLRSAASVGWYGSEVTYFEHIDWNAAPLIADAGRP